MEHWFWMMEVVHVKEFNSKQVGPNFVIIGTYF